MNGDGVRDANGDGWSGWRWRSISGAERWRGGTSGARLPREEGLGEAGSDAHEVPRLRVGITRERRLALVHGARVSCPVATTL